MAVHRLLSDAPQKLAAEGRGIIVMVVSILLTICLVLWQRRVARQTGSRVVAADSLHYMSGLVAQSGSHCGAVDVAGVRDRADRILIVALAAACMLAFGAWTIGKGAWDLLMDRRADPAVIEDIAKLAGNWPGRRMAFTT